MKKPPIGITPRHVWEERRMGVLLKAIARYYGEGYAVPSEWIEEYEELYERKRKGDG